MLVVADKHIPFLQGILEPYFDVQYLEPEQITRTAIKNAEALLIRTRTHCNAELLEGSRVRFIATATIGYDHIDTAYCNAHGIYWTNSPGCNAQGVCDYVEEALRIVESRKSKVKSRKPRVESQKSKVESAPVPTLGIVGVGHVGSLVAKMAERKGYRVLLNDPPKGIGVSLEQIAHESDIITFHTPLIKTGAYPTYHLCDEAFLQKCKPDVVIINAARGGIVDEQALLKKVSSNNFQPSTLNSQLLSTLNPQLSTSFNPQLSTSFHGSADRSEQSEDKNSQLLSTLNPQLSTSFNSQPSTFNFIIDTWENEPHINQTLLEKALIGTYHIAGYTLQGKINATNMCLDALCKYFSLPDLHIPAEKIPEQHQLTKGWLLDVDKQLRRNPNKFEILRESYKLR